MQQSASDATPSRLARPAISWRDLLPARVHVSLGERLRVALGAVIGVLLAGLMGHATASLHPGLPWLVAPLGASAVLVFGVPASPFAQPWAVVAGNTLSTLIAMACVHLLGASAWSAAAAVGLAIAAMFALRCLHPPGGACALLVALSQVHQLEFALYSVLLGSVVMVAVGIVYNHATGRRYPHGQREAAPAPDDARSLVTEADLDAVLARYDQLLDVPRDDLQELLQQAEVQAHRRRFGTVRCRDIMSRDPLAVQYGTPLQDAWSLLRTHRIKALPVVDSVRRVVGIVTLADFMRSADLALHAGWQDKLRALIRPTPATHSDKPEAVGQIMTRQVRVASADRPIVDLVPLFADTGHHHIPVIDEEQRLVGIITQSDLVRALSRAA